jgi:hypothetical protein
MMDNLLRVLIVFLAALSAVQGALWLLIDICGLDAKMTMLVAVPLLGPLLMCEYWKLVNPWRSA